MASLAPKKKFLVGHLSDFNRDRLGFLERCAREHGDFIPLRFAANDIVFLNHPDYIEQVLLTQNRKFIKHYMTRLLKAFLGEGLLTNEGESWLRQRRLAQPSFHRSRIAGYGEVMARSARRMAESWQDGETRDIHQDMMHLTLEIVAKTLFNADVSGAGHEVGAAMEVLIDTFNERMDQLVPWPLSIPLPVNLRLKRAVASLDKIIYAIIAERRRGGQDPGDLLSLLLNARDADDASRMSDRQLRDEAVTLFLAGHETTAIVLSWAWYLLSRHPEVEAKLREELERELSGRIPSAADLPRLKYLDNVVTETMRLYPPAYLIGREAVEDCEIGGRRIKKGSAVLISQWTMHRDPRYFEEPARFDPDRWSGGLAQRIPKYAYFPFGGGPRLCIGAAFATMEASLIIAAVAQSARFTLQPGTAVTPWPSVTLRPSGGPRMIIARN